MEHQCYIYADLIPILIVGAVLLGATISLLCLFCWHKECDLLREDLLSYVMKIVEFMLLNKKIKDEKKTVLIKCLEKCTSQKEAELQPDLLKNSWILGFFMSAIFCSLLYTFTIFWDTFLVSRRQDNCVEGLDCYLIQNSQPISNRLNCSEYEMESIRDKDMSVICFNFVFDIGQAWADAGGALAATATEMLLLASLFNKITSVVLQFCCCTGTKKICHVIQLAAGFFICLLVVLPSVVTLALDKKKYTDVPKVAYPIILFFQILSIANIPWYMAYDKKGEQELKTSRID